MIRGTTPTFEFTLPFDCGLLYCAYITFSQGGTTQFEKSLDDCDKDGRKIKVTLSQEDTLKLLDSQVTEIQIRAKTLASEVIASQIITVSTDRILKDGVI